MESVRLKIVNIFSLSDDCFEFVFSNLALNDLLNLAESSRQFYTAVCLVFKQKYGDAKVTIGGGSVCCNDNRSVTSNPVKYHGINILNPLSALKILRNFGHLIWNIELNSSYFRIGIAEKVECYLAEYCSESLNTFSLYCNEEKPFFDGIDTTFKDVDILRVKMCNFGHHSKFSQLFPNVRVLKLGVNLYKTPQVIRMNLPSVKDLTIHSNKLKVIDIKEAFKLNPQLEKLDIYSIQEVAILRGINEYLPNLKCLELVDLLQEFFQEGLEPIHFEHVENLAIKIGSTLMQNFPLTFGSLENLFLMGPLKLNQQFLNFIGGIEHLKLLTIVGWVADESNYNQRFFQLKNISSNIEELNVGWLNHMSSHGILHFMKNNQSLHKFTINMCKMDDTIGTLRNNLGSEWSLTHIHERLIFERNSGYHSDINCEQKTKKQKKE